MPAEPNRKRRPLRVASGRKGCVALGLRVLLLGAPLVNASQDGCEISMLQTHLRLTGAATRSPIQADETGDGSILNAILPLIYWSVPAELQRYLLPQGAPEDYPDVDREIGVCRKLQDEDLQQPIRSIMEQQPADDGWCVFGGLGEWASLCAVVHVTGNASMFPALWAKGNKLIDALTDRAPKTLLFPGGQSLTIRDHVYPLDDVYCFVNGWYGLDRRQVLDNESYMAEVSKASCEPLVAAYSDLSVQDLNQESLPDAAVLESIMGQAEPVGKVNETIVEGMRLHAAAKCLLSDGKTPVCDIWNCAARACLPADGSNVLGYTSRGECPPIE